MHWWTDQALQHIIRTCHLVQDCGTSNVTWHISGERAAKPHPADQLWDGSSCEEPNTPSYVCSAVYHTQKKWGRQLIKSRIQLDILDWSACPHYPTSTMAPTSHSHRYLDQGMKTNFADSVRCMQQNSSQITDTSTYWHLRFTWIQLVPKIRFQLPCHIYQIRLV